MLQNHLNTDKIFPWKRPEKLSPVSDTCGAARVFLSLGAQTYNNGCAPRSYTFSCPNFKGHVKSKWANLASINRARFPLSNCMAPWFTQIKQNEKIVRIRGGLLPTVRVNSSLWRVQVALKRGDRTLVGAEGRQRHHRSWPSPPVATDSVHHTKKMSLLFMCIHQKWQWVKIRLGSVILQRQHVIVFLFLVIVSLAARQYMITFCRTEHHNECKFHALSDHSTVERSESIEGILWWYTKGMRWQTEEISS